MQCMGMNGIEVKEVALTKVGRLKFVEGGVMFASARQHNLQYSLTILFSHRLLWETGSQTVEAAYVVGIYSDNKLIGQGMYALVSSTTCISPVSGLADLTGLSKAAFEVQNL